MIYWFTSDVLAGVLGEGDILSVYDGTAWPVVPAGLVGVRVQVVGVVRVVGEELETEHVRVVLQHVAGGHVDHHLVVGVVLLLVHQQQNLSTSDL